MKDIIKVNAIPYEEGMSQHFLEITLKVEHCGRVEEQLWCFGKDDWQGIKKNGYFLA